MNVIDYGRATQTSGDGLTPKQCSFSLSFRSWKSHLLQKQWADPKTVFFLGLLLAATGFVSPSVALAGGLCFGFTIDHPFKSESSSLSKRLLQISVILLGFGTDLHQALQVGRSAFLYTATSIATAVALGLLLGKLLKTDSTISYLLTMGTAICAGSGIAALGPVLQATEEEISISMGTVFLLNAVALVSFPTIGWALHLSQSQFGLWAALAINDTSSVLGATARYGEKALTIGTTVKLGRALWLVPVSFITASMVARGVPKNGDARKVCVQVPWFIFLYLLAALIKTYSTCFAPFFLRVSHLGKLGLTATLFLIGSSLSRSTLQRVGFRPFLQGLLLWLLTASSSLGVIYFGSVSL